MTKKHLIALADAIRAHNGAKVGFTEPLRSSFRRPPFTADHIETLADFCQKQNPNFNRKRWLDYIVG